MTRKKAPELIDLPEDTLDGIKFRITTGTLLEEDKKIIVVILTSYAWLLRQLQYTKISIVRLKNLFGFSTEKRKNNQKKQDSLTSTGALSELDELQGEQPQSLNDMQGVKQEPPEKKVVKPPVWDELANHGRIGAKAYTGCEEITLKHPSLAVGSSCPCCAEANTVSLLGTEDDPQLFIRLVGGPLITGTCFVAPILRCRTCKERFYTPVPDDIKNAPKYDVSVASTLAIARYSLGIPMYRTEQNQSMHGIPLKDATQWDLNKKLYTVVNPIFNEMIQQASNGSLMVYDDTTGRIVENKVKGLATHTTAYISVVNGHKVHLFFTGTDHAGKNATRILTQRTTDEPVIAMMDASPNNIPKSLSTAMYARFILCFCLVHGRRKFFEVFNFFDKECDLVLHIIGQVFAHDEHCKKHQFSPQERLAYHQKHSAPLMQTLYIWLNNQLLYEQSESNSGLGKAVRYMLKYWMPLTTFLRVAGAPLDSSWAERAIKIAIRHRRNSLFYKTRKGAEVGDCLMSIIYTAKENGVNPYDYLNTVQHYPEQVKANPERWLPWNYTLTLASITEQQAA